MIPTASCFLISAILAACGPSHGRSRSPRSGWHRVGTHPTTDDHGEPLHRGGSRRTGRSPNGARRPTRLMAWQRELPRDGRRTPPTHPREENAMGKLRLRRWERRGPRWIDDASGASRDAHEAARLLQAVR